MTRTRNTPALLPEHAPFACRVVGNGRSLVYVYASGNVHILNSVGCIEPHSPMPDDVPFPFRPVATDAAYRGRRILVEASTPLSDAGALVRVDADNALLPTERDALADAMRGLVQHHAAELAARYIAAMEART